MFDKFLVTKNSYMQNSTIKINMEIVGTYHEFFLFLSRKTCIIFIDNYMYKSIIQKTNNL